jgi:hypothetical protein
LTVFDSENSSTPKIPAIVLDPTTNPWKPVLGNSEKYLQTLYENGSTSGNLTGKRPDVTPPTDPYWFWVWLIVLLFMAIIILVCVVIKCLKAKKPAEEKIELLPCQKEEVVVERAKPVQAYRIEYGKESCVYDTPVCHETSQRVDLECRLVEVRISSPGKEQCITKYDYDGEDWSKYSRAHWNEY